MPPPAEVAAGLFAKLSAASPRLFRAPGRINVIGEHTDYSDGFVLPGAIDRACVVAVAPNGGDGLRVRAAGRGDAVELPARFSRRGDWTDYVAGVRAALADAGIVTPGCDLAIASDVPEGAGVSSSAAIEVAVALALLAAAGRELPPREVARIARAAENRYVGVPCGVMDQYAATHGEAGGVLLLDCRTERHWSVRAPEEAAFLVVDSGVRHQLADGAYAARRADVEAAAAALGVAALRDVDRVPRAGDLPPRLLSRARHVVSENARSLEAAEALAAGDLAAAGALMTASHASLRDDFEVTCPETDRLAAICAELPQVHGARQMGGGFGGAVLALVDREAAAAVAAEAARRYRQSSGHAGEAFVCTLSDGAGEIAP
jgi:galactokinase